jgi:hypothetical protein
MKVVTVPNRKMIIISELIIMGVDPRYGCHYTAFPERKLETKEREQIRNQRQRIRNNENETKAISRHVARCLTMNERQSQHTERKRQYE